MKTIKTPAQISKEGINGYINADFKWAEFCTPENGKPSLAILQNIKSIADILSIYKHRCFNGQIITITSGYRSVQHNKDVYKQLNSERAKKGLKPLAVATKSWHLTGLAVDFRVKGFTKLQVYKIMNEVHFGGVETPDDQNRIHIDLRGKILRFNGATGAIATSDYNLYKHNQIFHPVK